MNIYSMISNFKINVFYVAIYIYNTAIIYIIYAYIISNGIWKYLSVIWTQNSVIFSLLLIFLNLKIYYNKHVYTSFIIEMYKIFFIK